MSYVWRCSKVNLHPIPEFVRIKLRNQKKCMEDWKELVGDLYEDQDLVICTNSGSIQNPRNVNHVMKRIVKQSKVLNIRFHDIRHTYASILIAEGVDIVKISNRLGHSNPKITFEYYAHLLPNSDNDVADIFHNAIQIRVNNKNEINGGYLMKYWNFLKRFKVEIQ